MAKSKELVPTLAAIDPPVQEALTPPQRVAQYRRNIFPHNVVLSADDLYEFTQILSKANDRARVIEYNALDIASFDTPELARARVEEFVAIEYEYTAASDDITQGRGMPNTRDLEFPDDLKGFFVSNATYAQRAINTRPLNVVDAFLSFEKPSLKIDWQTVPSNATANRSVINIYGRDEDWVISTEARIQDFLRRKKSYRPAIHGSGTYDYLVYLVFLPTLIWLYHQNSGFFGDWLRTQTTFINVIIGIYALLLSLLFIRFVFQYVRWLFPPMEFYKTSRWRAYLHRTVAGLVLSTVVLNAIYDMGKSTVIGWFGP
ncbi:hypothetical protein IHQ71_11795 [Rhizobium sp. TH2]|uniref:hypothetical protein n=1 Tax=Rhizobium sp. TH2 TaxID=2775403 RepID=UPI0021573DFE|nr:hypothetical protein [Rhizobium sp. TH2]UVC11190.1 hypothetical protein IHQ71_11795 [Rhizobium sp. TH2]